MLIAATGLSGAGKTTALQFLSAMGVGEYCYVGGIVNAEIEARQLSPTPENERLVREAMRVERGMAALAERAAAGLRDQLNNGHTILVDAICNTEEGGFYREQFGNDLLVLAIDAPFEIRAKRLSNRPHRPMTADQLRERDRYEIEKLRLDQVMSSANRTMSNVGGIAEFQEELRRFAQLQLG